MAGDKAVTSHYLKIIYEAIIKAGKECAFGWIDGAPKSDTLIFDECKVALKYRLRGYTGSAVRQGAGAPVPTSTSFNYTDIP